MNPKLKIRSSVHITQTRSSYEFACCGGLVWRRALKIFPQPDIIHGYIEATRLLLRMTMVNEAKGVMGHGHSLFVITHNRWSLVQDLKFGISKQIFTLPIHDY